MAEEIAVLGAGVMGAGIAQVLAVAGHVVRCRDLTNDVLDGARHTVTAGRFGIEGTVARGKITQAEADAALHRLQFTTDLEEAVSGATLIIEAVPEQLDLKIRLWKDLDSLADQQTIFASNSSGFPIQAMAAATDRADRMIGWHWASPAPVMKLAEIIRGPETSQETVDTVVGLAKSAGKNPIVVQDDARHWGYVANRVYFAMIAEANAVVRSGVADRDQVDQLMMDTFRWPSGPFGMVKGAGSGWD